MYEWREHTAELELVIDAATEEERTAAKRENQGADLRPGSEGDGIVVRVARVVPLGVVKG